MRRLKVLRQVQRGNRKHKGAEGGKWGKGGKGEAGKGNSLFPLPLFPFAHVPFPMPLSLTPFLRPAHQPRD
jgi:hypothetical protein